MSTPAFVRTPENMEVLGVVPQRDAECATVMFCDLTSSSTLFQELNVSAAVQHINEYLQAVCDVAFAHGATRSEWAATGATSRRSSGRRLDGRGSATPDWEAAAPATEETTEASTQRGAGRPAPRCVERY